ncbi:MAG: 2-oxoacid:acceptor oxidoreductase family protein [Spirochaetota bacterium]|nr:2-oxoacid:acceptor oxidoreductase family protein [Spirochaetota bacterium]
MSKQTEKEILISGFGGQGIVLTGNIIGKAATLYDNKFATMTQSYGPEARGGSCSSQVVISEEEILFPYVENPQILICMSHEGFNKNRESLIKGGLLIWDSDLVTVSQPDESWKLYNIPATRFAEELGNKMMANIVILGFFSALSEVICADSLCKAVLISVPAKTKEMNSIAFDRGREYGMEILKSYTMQEKRRGIQ